MTIYAQHFDQTRFTSNGYTRHSLPSLLFCLLYPCPPLRSCGTEANHKTKRASRIDGIQLECVCVCVCGFRISVNMNNKMCYGIFVLMACSIRRTFLIFSTLFCSLPYAGQSHTSKVRIPWLDIVNGQYINSLVHTHKHIVTICGQGKTSDTLHSPETFVRCFFSAGSRCNVCNGYFGSSSLSGPRMCVGMCVCVSNVQKHP